MSPAVSLGLRLAVGTPGQRARSATVAGATAVAAWVMLSTTSVAVAAFSTTTEYSAAERGRLAAAIVIAVSLPVVVLVASVGRLSAAVRDRRLASLRVLGLPAARTRLVAATEVAATALVGTLVGSIAYVATRPLLTQLSLAGHSWSTSTLHPGIAGWGLTLLMLVTVVGAAALPWRGRSDQALDRTRRRAPRRPSWWWAAPIAVGLALLASIWLEPADTDSPEAITRFFVGTTLTGLGTVLLAPILVRRLGDLLLRWDRGPAYTIAARRLQSQPGSMVRAVSALMLGLFLVSGARGVLADFEQASSYQRASASLHEEERGWFQSSPRSAERDVAELRSLSGVRDVLSLPTFSAARAGSRIHHQVLVATCDQLRRINPSLQGCVDAPMRVGAYDTVGSGALIVHRSRGTLRFAWPEHTLLSSQSNTYGSLDPLNPQVVLPPDTPGLAPLLDTARRTGFVTAAPGSDVWNRAPTVRMLAYSGPDLSYYEFISGIGAIVWAVASVVLAVGLLTLAVNAVDRGLGRRRELASLQALGTPPAVLQRAQLVEAAVPALVACLVAIGCGFLGGAAYLHLADYTGHYHAPWGATAVLTVIAVVVTLAVAAATTLATNIRLRPDVIRQE